MHIHTSTSSTYFFLTNKQTNNTWVWFWRIFDTTHSPIRARIGPSAYSGPEPGGTMVNGILAFSPIRIPSAIASPSPLLSHLTQTIRGISSHLQDFVLPWLQLQYIAILCWGCLIQYILVCSDTVRLSDAIWGQLMKRWFCPIDKPCKVLWTSPYPKMSTPSQSQPPSHLHVYGLFIALEFHWHPSLYLRWYSWAPPYKDVGTWWLFSRFPAKSVSLTPPHWRHQLAAS